MTAKSGAFCLEHARLEYDGPRTADDLWADERFRHVALVRVGNAASPAPARTLRMVGYCLRQHRRAQLSIPRALMTGSTIAGTQVGIGDWRPQHGRFQAQRL